MRSRYIPALFAAGALVVMTTAAAVAAPASHARVHTTTSASRATLAASAAPAAAPQASHPGSCAYEGTERYCLIPVQDVPSAAEPYPVIFQRSNGIPVLITGLVSITCWYYGTVGSAYPNDGILDHTVEPVVGHIPDPYVNEGDENPWDSPYDLPQC